MKNYLSFGGGVNSVAMHLLLLDQKVEFEAIFVDHGTDWPETYEYFEIFQQYLNDTRNIPITVLKPNIKGVNNLYDYCWNYKMVPSFMFRWCTDKFKIQVVNKHIETPCFMLLGIDAGESHRAKISIDKGVEKRYPLIEADINRDGCKEIIKAHGLPIPMKSGCYICPYQRVSQWKELRKNHPDLFCKAEKLEQRNMDYRIEKGKVPLFLNQNPKATLRAIVNEKQYQLFSEDEYPPCQCEL